VTLPSPGRPDPALHPALHADDERGAAPVPVPVLASPLDLTRVLPVQALEPPAGLVPPLGAAPELPVLLPASPSSLTACAPPPVRLLGQSLEAVDLAAAAGQVMELVRSGRGGLVVTMNVDHAVQLEKPGALRDAYARAALRYADGMPIVWLSQLTRRPLPARVAGSDLVPLVLELAAQSGLRVHLVGGAPEVAAEAERRILEAYPTLTWTGHVSPPRGFDLDPEVDLAIAEQVAQSRPHLVLVCLGAPKQEAWALRHEELLRSSVLLCVGATVDFLAGTQRRAPAWACRMGLEWVHRLASEPRRLWRRYLVDDRRFLTLALAEVLADRRSAGVRPPAPR
jgi:N-acetylglucosaminyldiphosphoundecaprenol N-acetyl-beta-D-mannosaminyltransferase